MVNILKTANLYVDPCLGLVASQHDVGALNASANVFFVLMTIPRAPLCCATDSCQHVIVFSHRPQPVSFRVQAHFVLIFILHRKANVSHSHLLCHPTYRDTSVPNDAVATLASCSLGSVFQFPRGKKTAYVDRSHSVFLTVSKTPLRHDRLVPNPFLFMLHIHRPYEHTGL